MDNLKNIFSKPLKFTVISNIVFEPYLYFDLKALFEKINTQIEVSYIYGNQLFEIKQKLKTTDYIVVCLNFDELYPDIANMIASNKLSGNDILFDISCKCKELYKSIKDSTNVPIIWLGFEDFFCNHHFVCGNINFIENLVERSNELLQQLLHDSDIYINMKRLIAEVGINNAYDVKGKYRWKAVYSKKLIYNLSNEIYKQYLIYIGSSKKCVVIDCDNVLWGGILSEDGIEKIQISSSGLGREYQDFQRFLLMLYYHGIILAISSKNDETDVLQVFRNHSGMILKEEHIACFKVNWENKVVNLQRISDELNISLDSIVFVDDSEFEIQSVKTLLPDVTSIQYDKMSIYENLSCFNLKKNVDIENISKRSKTYQTNILREQIKSKSKSFDDYLNAIGMQVNIHETIPAELCRISELTQRTNKCTNGKRYTSEELKQKMEMDEYVLYTVMVSDKFSDLGIVGVLGLLGSRLDIFALSCRALGRKIEENMFELLKQNNVKEFDFYFTGKNDELIAKIKKLNE